MIYVQLTDKKQVAFYLDDLIQGCKALAKKNVGASVQHTLRMIDWNIEHPNCFFLIAEHRKRCVGFLFAMAVTEDTRWCEVLALYAVPGLAKRVKYDVWDMLKRWCKSKDIHTVTTQITRGVRVHGKHNEGAFLEWFYRDLGFVETGKVLKATV